MDKENVVHFFFTGKKHKENQQSVDTKKMGENGDQKMSQMQKDEYAFLLYTESRFSQRTQNYSWDHPEIKCMGYGI